MKKGAKLREDNYLLEISDLDNYQCTIPTSYKSLRQAVADASIFVSDMDSYLKVYRDFTAMNGAYVGVFFSKVEAKPRRHFIVKITASELLTRDMLGEALALFKPSSQNEPQAASGR
jgi:hypothetical protein